jgi:ElaB/YqjD/DUF883 family membrane-anchored ribosome-binding protein
MDKNPTDRIREQVETVKDAYEESKQSVRELGQAAVDTSKEAVAVSDEWVRGNTWKLLAVAALAGLIIGLLARSHDEEPDSSRVPR